MNNFTKPLESLSKSAKEYVDLRLDDLKLRTAKGLSISLSQLLSFILILSILSVTSLTLAIGLILIIANLINSYIWASFIVSAIFLLAAIIVYFLRHKLFVNQFIRVFINIFFGEDD